MRRDYLVGVLIVAVTIILTVLLWLFFRSQELPVYILVVDDFDGKTISDVAESNNCVVDPSGTAFLSGSGTAFLSGSGTAFLSGSGTAFLSGSGTGFDKRFENMTHGEIVREVVENSVGSAFPHKNIINVELDKYDTTHAAERIADTIEKMGPAYYIVNMSFSIVPCSYVEDLTSYAKLFQQDGSDINTLESSFNGIISNALDDGSKIESDPILTYIEQSCETEVSVPQDHLPTIILPNGNDYRGAVAAAADSAEIVAMAQSAEQTDKVLLSDNPPREINDNIEIPMPKLCGRVVREADGSTSSSDGAVIFVAAAGNGSLTFTQAPHPNIEFPFAPAVWDNVISISASIIIGQDGTPLEPAHPFSTFGFEIAPYSNYGAVKMPSPYQGLGGTSFAAPRYSALLGLLLTPGRIDPTYTSYCLLSTQPLPLPDSWPRDTAINQPVC